ncbi:MAG TPA: FkbM family methyltransferase [Ohtaekwangia sp.]|nr:FkbM family methyltransferase [Ohtaekwangia sp.]
MIQTLRHTARIIGEARRSRKPKAVQLIADYLRLRFVSFIFYNLLRARKSRKGLPETTILSFHVRFFEYSELINLFEEIFACRTYTFRSRNTDPLIIDCGSNIGLSVLYFKSIYPDCRIMAFEPNPKAFAVLKFNVEQNNLKGVHIFNVGLSDYTGQAKFYQSAANTISASVFQGNYGSGHELVEMTELSNFTNEEVDLLKIDIEGSEINVINDLIKYNKLQLVRNMIIEYHPAITAIKTQAFFALIESQGFRCASIPDDIHPNSTAVIFRCTRLDQGRTTVV